MNLVTPLLNIKNFIEINPGFTEEDSIEPEQKKIEKTITRCLKQ